MSNSKQIISTGIGAAVGFFVGGGPVGAYYGFQIGLLAGTALFPTQLEGVTGPRLQDTEKIEASPGAVIPRGWGTFQTAGFRLYLGPRRTVSNTEEVGGKGGPEQSVTTFTYFQTIALGLGKGPIVGVRRIWENGELKYDTREQLPDETYDQYTTRIAMSAEYFTTFVFYTGSETQTADPTMESEKGVGNVPGYRDLSYIVYPERALSSEQANRHPSWKFEVFKEGRAVESTIIVLGYHTSFGALTNKSAVHPTFAATPTSPSGFAMDTAEALVYIREVNRWVAVSGNAAGITHATPATIPVRYSEDDGATWQNAVSTDSDTIFEMHNLLQLPDTVGISGGMLVMCGGQNFFEGHFSTDRGLNWLKATTDDDLSTFQTCPHGYACIAGHTIVAMMNSGSRVFKTINGQAWTKQTTNLPSGCKIAWSPTLALYAGLVGGKVYTSPDAVSWIERATQDMSSDGTSSGGAIVWADKLHPPAFICVGATGTLRSVNGTTWTNVGPSPLGRNNLFASARGIVYSFLRQVGANVNSFQYSADAGASWTAGSFSTSYQWQAMAEKVAPVASPNKILVADIIKDLCVSSGLTVAQIDVTEIEDVEIWGFALGTETNARQAIEALRPIALFDIVESEAKIKFRARGAAPVATLTAKDFGAIESENVNARDRPPAITTSKLQDVELPRMVRLQYVSYARDFEPGEQLSPARIGTVGVNDVILQVPAVLDDDQAAQAAEIVMRDAWTSRWAHEFSLDQSWSHLEPGDVVLIPLDGRTYRVRLVAIDDAGLIVRKCTAVRDDDGVYVSSAVATPPQRPPTGIVLLGDTEPLMLDLPALRESDDEAGFYTAARRDGIGLSWAGATLSKSVDGGSSFSTIVAYGAQGIVGTVVTAPSSGDTLTWNDSAEYVIDIETDDATLSNRTDVAVLAGANAAAVGVHGRWHMFQFANATLVSPGRYRLSRLLLGRRGTEHLLSQVVPGDRFVLTSGSGVYRALLENSEIGVERTYRAVTSGASFESADNFAFTGQGQALECFSPTYILGARDGSSNLTITWLRRDRLGATLQDGVPTPMSEASEAYVVEIMNGVTVVRTISGLTAATATYSAANQTTDFGSPQASVSVRVYQVSAVVGRGTPGVATV